MSPRTTQRPITVPRRLTKVEQRSRHQGGELVVGLVRGADGRHTDELFPHPGAAR